VRRGAYTGRLEIDPAGMGVWISGDRLLNDFIRDVAADDDLEGGTFHAEIKVELSTPHERLTEAAKAEDEAWAAYISEKAERARS
jgi:hypothetical protein